MINSSDFPDAAIQSANIAVISAISKLFVEVEQLQMPAPYSIYSSKHDFVIFVSHPSNKQNVNYISLLNGEHYNDMRMSVDGLSLMNM